MSLNVNAIVCGIDGPLVTPDPDCPNSDQHEPQPTGYIPQMTWALRKMLTHHQPYPCSECGRWSIWVEGATDFDEAGGLTREDVLDMLGEDAS
jgi:hypothetical protein